MNPKCCQDNKNLTKELALTVKFLKVISEENRIKILCMLKDGEKCVCEIWEYLDVAQNLISHHLKVLKGFGLIKAKKDGLKVYYSLDKKMIKQHSKLFNKFIN